MSTFRAPLWPTFKRLALAARLPGRKRPFSSRSFRPVKAAVAGGCSSGGRTSTRGLPAPAPCPDLSATARGWGWIIYEHGCYSIIIQARPQGRWPHTVASTANGLIGNRSGFWAIPWGAPPRWARFRGRVSPPRSPVCGAGIGFSIVRVAPDAVAFRGRYFGWPTGG